MYKCAILRLFPSIISDGQNSQKHLEKTKNMRLLLNDVKTAHISGLYDYMRNHYRNPQQIKQNDGRLSNFSLMLFGQTINAMFNIPSGANT